MWNVTPCLSLNVYVRPLAEDCYDVAKSGWRVPAEVGKTKVSYSFTSAAELASSEPLAGSETGTFAKVTLRVPEASVGGAVVLLVVALLGVLVAVGVLGVGVNTKYAPAPTTTRMMMITTAVIPLPIAYLL